MILEILTAIGFYALKTAAIALTAWTVIRIAKCLIPCLREPEAVPQRIDIRVSRDNRAVVPRAEQNLKRRNRAADAREGSVLRYGTFMRPITVRSVDTSDIPSRALRRREV